MKFLTAFILTLASIAASAQCDTVTNTTISEVTTSSAKITAIPPVIATITSYSLSYYRAGGATTTLTAGTPNKTITGLVPNTTYYVYWTTNCGSTSASQVGRYSFTTTGTTPTNNKYTIYNVYGWEIDRLRVKQAFHLPTHDTTSNTTYSDSSLMVLKPSDSTIYYKYKSKWIPLKTGDVTTELDPVWLSEKANYYTKTQLQTGGLSSVHWNNITNTPTFITTEVDPVFVASPSYGITSSKIAKWDASTDSIIVSYNILRGVNNDVTHFFTYKNGNTLAQTIKDSVGLTGNQTITLSGDVTGSGTTSIPSTVNWANGYGTYDGRFLKLTGGTLNTQGAANPTLTIAGNDQSNTRIRFINTGKDWAIVQGVNGASNDGFSIYDGTAGATRFSIAETTGNVGVGTTNPLYRFHVNVGTDLNLQLRTGAAYGDGSALLIQTANNADNAGIPMQFGASKFQFMSGNVGIGTTDPQSRMDISSGATTNNGIILRSSITENTENRNWAIVTNRNAYGDFVIATSTVLGGNPLTAGIDRFNILANGSAKLGAYGLGTITGIPTYLLASDASGNVIETTDANNYVTSGSFNSVNGYITLNRNGLSDLAIAMDGRYALLGSGGVTTMAAIGSSPNANGATISGSTLTLQPASSSFGGVITTGNQTFAGNKTFSGDMVINQSGGNRSINITGTNNIAGLGLFSTISAIGGVGSSAWAIQLYPTFPANANDQEFFGLYIQPTTQPSTYTGIKTTAIQTTTGGVHFVSDASGGNLTLGKGNESDGGGDVTFYMRNAATVPSSNPTNGGVLYVEGGALKYRSAGGTVTTIANN